MKINRINAFKLIKLGFLTICVLLPAYFVLSNIYSTQSFYTNSFVSDYETVLGRYLAYQQNKLSLWNFLTIKQANHNHFFIFLLSFLDIKLAHGSKALLFYATAISNLVLLGIIIYCLIRCHQLKNSEKILLTLFSSAQIYSFLGAEIWLYPFQAVLATFRLFLVLSILLFCFSLDGFSLSSKEYKVQLLLLSSMIAITFLAAISHGGGIILLPILLIYSVILRKKQHIIILVSLIGLLFFYGLNSPSQGQLSSIEIVKRSLQSFGVLIDKSLYVIGYYSGLGGVVVDKVVLKLVGLLGSAVYFLIITVAWRKYRELRSDRSTYPIYLFFTIWATFSFIGSMMSVMTNIGYAEIRNAPMTHSYFLASRYSVTISGFWISIAVLSVIATKIYDTKFSPIFLKSFIFFSSLVVWLNGMLMLPTWKLLYQDFINGEVALRASALSHLPADEATRSVGLTLGAYQALEIYVDVQRRNSLGPFAANEAEDFVRIVNSGDVHIGKVEQVEQLTGGFYRVRGILFINPSDYLKISTRPVPLVDKSRNIVGVAIVTPFTHFQYESNAKALSFFGYTKDKNPQTLEAIFPTRSTSFIRSGVRYMDHLSQNAASGLKYEAVRLSCSFHLDGAGSYIQPEKFSDVNWINGISTHGTGFFTQDVCKTIGLKLGDTLTFSGSGSRKIIRISGEQVWLDGSPLNSVKDGYPNTIKVE